MKRAINILLTTLFILSANKVHSQMVFIPDTAFRSFLTTNYPSCMSGDSIDASCPVLQSITAFGVTGHNISDLTGIEVFSNLENFSCNYNNLSHLPNFPSTLKYLWCGNNFIDSLPILPNGLKQLDCSANLIQHITTLPDSIKFFNCDYNQISNIDFLPSALTNFSCVGNNISLLPTLPQHMVVLSCNNNSLTSLPALPNELTFLNCSYNQLTSLASIPDSLTDLRCNSNQLTSVPSFPAKLSQIICDHNQISEIPDLPNTFPDVDFSFNQLTTIHSIPDSLNSLSVNDNPALSCLPVISMVNFLYFNNTSITCIPNYANVVFTSVPDESTFPLCSVNNTNNCSINWNISGKVYFDSNINCTYDVSETGVSNQRIRLLKNNIFLKETYTGTNGMYSFKLDSLGEYQVGLDTAYSVFQFSCLGQNSYLDTITATDSLFYNQNFGLNCNNDDYGVWSIISSPPRPGFMNEVKTAAGNFTSTFGANCGSGVGGIVQIAINGPAHFAGASSGSIVPNSINGDTIIYNIADFGATQYNTSFNFFIQVDSTAQLGSQICFSASLNAGIVESNLLNNQISNCFTVVGSFDPNDKSVSPVGIMEINSDRWLTYLVRFQNTGTASAQNIYITDTLSQLVDWSTFSILSYSHEPTVQLTNGGVLTFDFPNINLPDSNANEPASHGYVQYKIRAKDSLILGSEINNTANIFFDFNPPVITNTTANTVIDCNAIQASINQSADTLFCNLPNAIYQWIDCANGVIIPGASNQVFYPTYSGDYKVVVSYGTCADTSACYPITLTSIHELNEQDIQVSPNPFSKELKINLGQIHSGNIDVVSLIGELILSQQIQSGTVILNTQELPSGMYLLKVKSPDGIFVKRVVKQ